MGLNEEVIKKSWMLWALSGGGWIGPGVWGSAGDCLRQMRDHDLLPAQLKALVGVPQDPTWHPEGWSCREASILPVRPCGTGPAQALGPDLRIGLRQLISAALTNPTFQPLLASTATTKTAIALSSSGLPTADEARPNSLSTTPQLSEAVDAQTKGFVFTLLGLARARAAHEVIRVVTKIPLSGMSAVMLRADNDFEIIKSIVLSVAVYVMNVLEGKKLSSEFKFLQEAMEPNIPGRLSFRCGDVDVDVSTVVVNLERGPVDDNVVFDFDMAVVRNGDVGHDGSPLPSCTPNHRLLEVCIGDAFEHTCCTVDAMWDICVRENLDEAKRVQLMLTMVCHDMGKATTTVQKDGRWRSPGHDLAGVEPARDFLNFTVNFTENFDPILKLVRWHMSHCRKDFSQKSVRKLVRELYPSNISDLCLVMEADCRGRGSASSGLPESVTRDLIPHAQALGLFHGNVEVGV